MVFVIHEIPLDGKKSLLDECDNQATMNIFRNKDMLKISERQVILFRSVVSEVCWRSI